MCGQDGQTTLDDLLRGLRNYLSRFLRDSGRHVSNRRFDTSDVIQESLIQIWSECQKDCSTEQDDTLSQNSNGTESLQTVSFARLRRIALGHLSKQFRFHGAAKRSVRRESQLVSSSLPYDDQTAADICETREMYLEFMVNLNLLDGTKQIVVYRRMFKDESYTVIAKQLGMTVYAVRTEFKNAIRQLQSNVTGAAV